jgi:hypothetical protein
LILPENLSLSSQGHFIKITDGAYFVDEDAWYPHILSLMTWCAEKKLPYAIVPVGDSAATFLGENPEVISWLTEKGKRARASRPVPAKPGQ